ncbi:MAG TPA: HlyD family efflux transporter periplasmic adaptor subunit [Microvirga sp.]
MEAATSDRSAASLPVAPLSWQMLGAFLLGIVGIVAAFVTTADYARKETAVGSLVASGGAVRVSAMRGGIVADLQVGEGERVRAGQPLFTVSSQQSLTAGGTLDRAVLASLDVQIAVLMEQIAADPARVALERTQLDAGINSVRAEREALQHQRTIMAERVQVTVERHRAVATLVERGSATRTALQESEEALLSRRQALADLDRQLAAIDKELGQVTLQREQLPVQQAERLSGWRLSLADRERQKTEVQAQGAQVITAPVSGRVTALQIRSGHVVDANRPLLTIVPDGPGLEAEVYVPSRAIGFVGPGQPVRLMVDAFPFQRFGIVRGTVATVSQAVLAPSDVLGRVVLSEPAYRVTVRLERQAIEAFGKQVELQPDMTLKADIVLESRSLIAWLLEPLFSARGRM